MRDMVKIEVVEGSAFNQSYSFQRRFVMEKRIQAKWLIPIVLFVMGFGSVGLLAQDWSVGLTINGNYSTKGPTEQGDFVQTRTFGGDVAGTGGFDTGLDVLTPPPGYTFYSYFYISAFPHYLEKDIRGWAAPYDTPIEWELRIEKTGETGVTQVYVKWDPAGLPSQGNFDIDGVDMRTNTYVEFSSDSTLHIHYTLGAPPPDWSVNPAAYQYSMNLIGVILFDDDESTDTNDKIGAFVDGECRGVASPSLFPVTGRYTFGMTIYSNATSGETISFKAWDASADQVYGEGYGIVLETYSFVPDNVIGTDNNPEEIHAMGVFPYSKAVVTGWNWFSVNVRASDMSLNSVLASLGENAAFTKNQVAFATYYTEGGFGWYSSNGLDSLDSRTMYMMKMNSPDTISYMGTPCDYQTPIDLANGWNWIGYPCQQPNSLGNALASIEGIGVFIKNQVAFATYYTEGGFGWYSSNGLDNLVPTDGYMLKTNASGTLVYPVPASSGLAKKAMTKQVASNGPNWNVDPHNFEHSMAVTGVVIVDGVESNDGSDVVGAFVGNECRGVASIAYFPLAERYEFGMLVYGQEGEDIMFKVFDASTQFESPIVEQLPFEVDGIVGHGMKPHELTAFPRKCNELVNAPTEYSLGQNYPNPFNPETTIHFSLPKQSQAQLVVYNTLGQVVRTLISGNMAAGRHSVVWDGLDERGERVESGIYIYKIMADGFNETRKAVFMK